MLKGLSLQAGHHSADVPAVDDLEPVLRRVEAAAVEDGPVVPGGGVGHLPVGGQVDLTAPGFCDDPVHVPGGDPRPGEDLNAPRGVGDHVPHGVRAQGHVRLLPAGQHAGDAQLDELIQRRPPVRHHVDGPVEHALLPCGLGQLRQYAGALRVQGAVLVEEAEHQPVRPVGQQQFGVLHRRGELRLRVVEAPLPGPHHGHDPHTRLPLGHDQLPQGGGKPPVEQIAVQLHPIRPRLVGLDHVVRASAADLQQYPAHTPHLLNVVVPIIAARSQVCQGLPGGGVPGIMGERRWDYAQTNAG